jgi:hypothetical protein
MSGFGLKIAGFVVLLSFGGGLVRCLYRNEPIVDMVIAGLIVSGITWVVSNTHIILLTDLRGLIACPRRLEISGSTRLERALSVRLV